MPSFKIMPPVILIFFWMSCILKCQVQSNNNNNNRQHNLVIIVAKITIFLHQQMLYTIKMDCIVIYMVKINRIPTLKLFQFFVSHINIFSTFAVSSGVRKELDRFLRGHFFEVFLFPLTNIYYFCDRVRLPKGTWPVPSGTFFVL